MTTKVRNELSKVLNFLDELKRQKIAYQLEHVRDSIMVIASVPGERWEIEFFDDGHVEVERFQSAGNIENEEVLEDLIAQYGDPG